MADDAVNGKKLWKSDGTAAGTVMVADLSPGEEYIDSSGYSRTKSSARSLTSATPSIPNRNPEST